MKKVFVWTAVLACGWILTAAQGATTQPADTEAGAEVKEIRPFSLDAATMTDDWFGVGPELREIGISPKFFWNSHYYSNLRGGRTTGSLKHSATYDLFFTFDLEKMGLVKGGEVLVLGRQQWGGSVNAWTGSSQQVNDDADGDHSIYVDMLWYRQNFLDGKIALQLGYLDYQAIVDRNVYANSEDKQFMNATLDNNPLFPTASATGLGAAMYFKPCEAYTMILGAGDAQRLPLYKPGFSTTFHDEAWFLGYMEHDLHLTIPSARGDLTGNYRFGLVYDPTPRDVYVKSFQRPRMRGDDYGFYTSFDQMIFREGPDDTQGLGAFVRYAYRHGDIPHDAGFFNQFWSAGLAYTGMLPGRDKDTMGFAVAQLMPSPKYASRINRTADEETIFEWYYAIQLAPWLVLTPDVQYIDNPGGRDDNGISHAIAGGFKVRVTF